MKSIVKHAGLPALIAALAFPLPAVGQVMYYAPAIAGSAGATVSFSVAVSKTLGAYYTVPPFPGSSVGVGSIVSTEDEDPAYDQEENGWERRTFRVGKADFEFGFVVTGEDHESSRMFYQGSSPFPADVKIAGTAFAFDDFGFIVSPAGQMWILGASKKDNGLDSRYKSLYYDSVPLRECLYQRIAGKCIASWINAIPDLEGASFADVEVQIGPLTSATHAQYVAMPGPGITFNRTVTGAMVHDSFRLTGLLKSDQGYLVNPAGLAPHGLSRTLPVSVQDPQPGTVFPAGSVLFFLSTKRYGLKNNMAAIQSFIDQIDPGMPPLPSASLGIGASGPGSGPQRVQGRSRLCFGFDPLSPLVP